MTQLSRKQIKATGRITQLCQGLVAYVRSNSDEFQDKPEDEPEDKEETDRTQDEEPMVRELAARLQTLITSSPSNQIPQQTLVATLSNVSDTARIMDQMRKWNCHFDSRDLYILLEKIQELRTAYQLTERQMLLRFPKFLRSYA